MRYLLLLAFLLPGLYFAHPVAAEEAAYRTDKNDDEKLPWFQIEPGKFPPADSAHYFAGELIEMDHVHRTGELRVSRTDKQRRHHWDVPIAFRMLPYGSIKYHGALAALRDIPIGTHLHGWYYAKGKDEEATKFYFNRESIESPFNKAIRLMDDFSYYDEQKRLFNVESIDLEKKKLLLRGVDTKSGEADKETFELDVTPATRVFLGKQFATLEDVKPGQQILYNLTWATLYGIGRCTDLWLDEESREVARQRQFEQHRLHIQYRGVPGWIDEVDNQNRIVTVTLFDGVDPHLLEEFKVPGSVQGVVAEPTLQSYDQVNDRKSGPIVSVKDVDRVPGSSGMQVSFQPQLLLEGFRPGRIVRLFPMSWPMVTIPQEETLWPERQ
ncbi:hypothetical protein LOC68_06575 [Blastopirellula sp. JC732]|uniref:Uncharacterized protein n=1 Tax=Blastopirellula sediminis TaxID=2894196 RepID=A0A9X1MJ69_9BACT|nr:hypothetical protein [Blastopirellula sediminis]MCC9609170.1 hypothetical protein [Blastopirellula sediminis]MCC9628053.1 hypothetical protein [Blastopirellula sediminis]